VVLRGVRRDVNDEPVTLPASGSTLADAVVAFFADYKVASLRLPSGWFGRPNDNLHQLTDATMNRDDLVIRLDAKQVLTLDAESAHSDRRVLRVNIGGGHWRWTEYGGGTEHEELLGPGVVEFHAPPR
jgi:hypothetical protein